MPLDAVEELRTKLGSARLALAQGGTGKGGRRELLAGSCREERTNRKERTSREESVVGLLGWLLGGSPGWKR